MGEPGVDPAAAAKEAAKRADSKDAPCLEDLLKAHLRLVAAQRNAVGLSASLREAQQQMEVFSKEFQELRSALEGRTGLVYNDQTLALERRGEPKGKETG